MAWGDESTDLWQMSAGRFAELAWVRAWSETVYIALKRRKEQQL